MPVQVPKSILTLAESRVGLSVNPNAERSAWWNKRLIAYAGFVFSFFVFAVGLAHSRQAFVIELGGLVLMLIAGALVWRSVYLAPESSVEANYGGVFWAHAKPLNAPSVAWGIFGYWVTATVAGVAGVVVTLAAIWGGLD